MIKKEEKGTKSLVWIPRSLSTFSPKSLFLSAAVQSPGRENTKFEKFFRVKWEMENRRIIVLVEDVDSARSALKWAVHNLFRYGDFITLLHVYPSSRSKNKQKQRVRRLKGFQLALSFKDLCQGIPEAKVEIIVTEGDEGATIISLVEKIGASTLVVGIHDHSFIYRTTMVNNCINNLNCRVLAVKQPSSSVKQEGRHASAEFSQIEICATREQQRSHSFPIFSNSFWLIWRSKRKGSI